MIKEIKPLSITASTIVNAAGAGKKYTFNNIKNNASALTSTGYPGLNFDTYLGVVDHVDSTKIEPELSIFDCRNNRLAKMALDTDGFRESVRDAINKYGNNRIGLFMGTSTSGIAETENAYINRNKSTNKILEFDMLHTHNIGSLQDYVSNSLGLNGVGVTISTACSSSAKVFASAYRYIESGLCDAAIVGGVDSLCLTTLYGFNSLQLISSNPCMPWDRDRDGINIGEAAGFVLLEKDNNSNNIKFIGYGESSDAYHISTPHPNGDGAKIAIEQALARSGISAKDIDYINLHGTATPSNDKAESRALNRVFTDDILCSSTKGITGHTLGAAGINEAIICLMSLDNNIVPGNVNLNNIDKELPFKVVDKTQEKDINYVMSNSFGFGGSNCSLVFSC